MSVTTPGLGSACLLAVSQSTDNQVVAKESTVFTAGCRARRMDSLCSKDPASYWLSGKDF